MGNMFGNIPNSTLAPDPSGDMTPASSTNPTCGEGDPTCNDPTLPTIYNNPMNKQQGAASTFDTALGSRGKFQGISPLHL